MDELLSVSNLTKRFGSLLALDDISFTLCKGETLGIAGESGSGKTTLGRTLLRLIEPDSGSIIFSGVDICKCSDAEMRKLKSRLQIIFQNPYSSLDPSEKVGEAVRGPLANAKLLSKKEQRSKVLDALSLVGLPSSAVSRCIGEFSGGQRQRIAIARAMITSPDLIVADECLSSLDVSVRAGILNLLSSLQKDLGVSYLFISHDLSSLRFISQRIGVMYKGMIVEIAPVSEIFLHPLHPYTKELLSSELKAGEKGISSILQLGEGRIAQLSFHPCPYAHRCPSSGSCERRKPVLAEASHHHFVACNKFG
ncbi:MAG: ABC transporter ATP-binding protein [Spirochaetes bacterium]|uniref:ABC transporter ATP-binding protein n=1 Tax=Candidatus Ornithospirochaeta stercoripullorum TaxID=2840899 RepID=A0A9D9DZN6_9SPIO|nr:ABC transporter ATP-binding protein [Candidatus Ornithospirochaeta stercoripullorum]